MLPSPFQRPKDKSLRVVSVLDSSHNPESQATSWTGRETEQSLGIFCERVCARVCM